MTVEQALAFIEVLTGFDGESRKSPLVWAHLQAALGYGEVVNGAEEVRTAMDVPSLTGTRARLLQLIYYLEAVAKTLREECGLHAAPRE